MKNHGGQHSSIVHQNFHEHPRHAIGTLYLQMKANYVAITNLIFSRVNASPSSIIVFLKWKSTMKWWRDDSLVKNICHPSKGTGSKPSTHLGLTTVCYSSSRGSNILSSPYEHSLHVVHRHICRPNNYTHKKVKRMPTPHYVIKRKHSV